MGRAVSKQHLIDWNNRQALAEKMVPLIGSMYRGSSIVVRVFGTKIMNSSTTAIIKAHRHGKVIVGESLNMEKSFQMLMLLESMNLRPCRVDLGKLCHEYLQKSEVLVDESQESIKDSMQNYLNEKLAHLLANKRQIASENNDDDSHDVVLYGFGRIGRMLARLLIDRTGTGAKLRLRGVVVRAKGDIDKDLLKRAELLHRDSIHGEFDGSIQVDVEHRVIIANGNFIQFIYANSPTEIDYTAYGIKNALIVDNTGVWRDKKGLQQHISASGASKVLLTAPSKDDMKNIVYGINHSVINKNDHILCAASCTTNAIAPPLKVLNDEYGILSGHVETIHSYTNDQNLIDNFHSAERRGRSAALNMVITSTGAAKAVSKVLPELDGLLSGNAIRVPTPNVSMAVINLNLAKEVSKDELNLLFQKIAYHSPLQEQIGFTYSTEVVSSDLVGSKHAGVIDGGATIAEGSRVVLYVWYDNEAGYSNQVVRVMQKVVGLHLNTRSA